MQSSQPNYTEKIQTIQTSFFPVLDDFKKNFVIYKMHPEVDEYYNYYSASQGQLQTLSKELQSIRTDIDSKIRKLDKEMVDVNANLQKEKAVNKKFALRVANLKNTQNGSDILVDDSVERYNAQYFKNCELVVGIIILSGLIGRSFVAGNRR